uniref:Uncharacterized protein n=1 Tax=Nelumbo nucifera TaxID=4432 RepID=A0A822XBM8_NELNU|nr:TPA_asm: hypothetical protein HUJ06_019213 [Nelumbo nucifera]
MREQIVYMLCLGCFITLCWAFGRHRMNESDAYKYFVLRAQHIALSHGFEIVNWEETFNNFGKQLNPKTVVHNWYAFFPIIFKEPIVPKAHIYACISLFNYNLLVQLS